MQKLLNQNFPAGPVLVVIPGVPAVRKGAALVLDDKAVAGLKLYKQYWGGRLRCVFREGPAEAVVFGSSYDLASLPFEIAVVPEAAKIPVSLLQDAAVVLASADNHLDFPLADQCRSLGISLVFVIEYTFKARLRTIAYSSDSLIKRFKSVLWATKTEFIRRRTIARADALQANGTPAASSYTLFNRNTLTYFDNRLSAIMLAAQSDIAAKTTRRARKTPLRLAFSGRLERMKGADDLLPLIERLIARGVDFQFDIFGSGSFLPVLQEAARRPEFANRLTVHGPVQFDTELVPWMRENADIFVCCHPQSDPSCTYMETLGCGVPIAGYANDAFRGIMSLADVGWLAPRKDIDALADQIAQLSLHRETIAEKARNAVALAEANCFETVFFNRVEHLREIAFRGSRSIEPKNVKDLSPLPLADILN